MTGSQYFEPRPAAASAPETVEVLLPDLAFTIVTDRGVFAHGRLDRGTRLLLAEQVPLPETGALLDLGCGAGPIALTMAQRRPGCPVWAVDVNERARELTEANARRLGLDNVRVAAPAAVPPDVRFAAIWSNPPIRVGKAALHDLLRTWLARLTAEGEALLVVHKHLGSDSLATWLAGEGWAVQRVTSRAGYRLLRVGRGADRAEPT